MYPLHFGNICGAMKSTHTYMSYPNFPLGLSFLIICHFGYTLLGLLIILGQILV